MTTGSGGRAGAIARLLPAGVGTVYWSGQGRRSTSTHAAAAAERQRGVSADGRARRAWVDGDGSRSVTLGGQLNG